MALKADLDLQMKAEESEMAYADALPVSKDDPGRELKAVLDESSGEKVEPED